jgi:hypothetical protein
MLSLASPPLTAAAQRPSAACTASSKAFSLNGLGRTSTAPARNARVRVSSSPCGEEDDGGADAGRGQPLLQLESTHPRHPHIEEQALRRPRVT